MKKLVVAAAAALSLSAFAADFVSVDFDRVRDTSTKQVSSVQYVRANKDFDGFNFFYHNNDDYTLTSKGIIWSYPNKPYNKKCVVVLPEWNTSIFDLSQLLNSDCYGICTDFVNYLK